MHMRAQIFYMKTVEEVEKKSILHYKQIYSALLFGHTMKLKPQTYFYELWRRRNISCNNNIVDSFQYFRSFVLNRVRFQF